MNPLVQKLRSRASGLLLYGLTPPKSENPEENIRAITERRIERLSAVNIDGLILYDIQDESARNDEERPFPFLPTLDPIDYYHDYLSELDVPPILYQCVGKHDRHEIATRMHSIREECVVFVGSSSRSENVRCTLKEAYSILNERDDGPYAGGIVIPERDAGKGEEHLRLVRKQNAGVNFFISQFIFDAEKLKNVLSDYHYHLQEDSRDPAPIIFTVTPCGSPKTVELLKWLGVAIPRWMENDLSRSADALSLSMELCLNTVHDISHYCMARGIPFGCNVESVSIRKEEVLASFELVRSIETRFRELGLR